MNRILLVCGAAGILGLAGPALAQRDDFDVTLEVLDDVSDVDAVILSLEEERDELERRETGERDVERERDARDERADVERELERDFERDRGRELDGDEDDRDAVIEDRDIERERDAERNEERDELDREVGEREALEVRERELAAI